MKKSLGLFGVGRWGKNIARNFYELGVLNSIYDPSYENIQSVKDNFKDVCFCKNEDEIFSNPNIDKVAIATRIPSHTRLIIKALQSKKDVFVEKPICFELEEAELIKTTAKENNKIVMVGHILHYHPVVIKLKELIRQGIIGELISISSTRLGNGYIKEEKNSLWNLAIHDISLILSIVNSMPESLLALTKGIFEKQSDDIYNCFFNFPNNIKAHIKVNWLNLYKEQKFIVTGSKGLFLFDDLAKWDEKLKLYIRPNLNDYKNSFVKRADSFSYVTVDYKEPLKNECEYFLKCSENKLDPFTNVDESIQIIKIIKTLLNYVNANEFLPLIKNCLIQPSFNKEELSDLISNVQNRL